MRAQLRPSMRVCHRPLPCCDILVYSVTSQDKFYVKSHALLPPTFCPKYCYAYPQKDNQTLQSFALLDALDDCGDRGIEKDSRVSVPVRYHS